MPIVLCWSQPTQNQCHGWIGPYGPYYDCKMPCSNNYQETLKKKQGLLLTRPGYYMAHLGLHSKVSDRETENGPGVLLLPRLRVGA